MGEAQKRPRSIPRWDIFTPIPYQEIGLASFDHLKHPHASPTLLFFRPARISFLNMTLLAGLKHHRESMRRDVYLHPTKQNLLCCSLASPSQLAA